LEIQVLSVDDMFCKRLFTQSDIPILCCSNEEDGSPRPLADRIGLHKYRSKKSIDEFDARRADRFPVKQMIADRLTADGTYAHGNIVKICAFEMMKNSIVHTLLLPAERPLEFGALCPPKCKNYRIEWCRRQ
jgi:hypothetical protein